MRRTLTILLLVAVLGIALNDIVKYANAQTHLNGATYDIALFAAKEAQTQDRDTVAVKLVAAGEEEGVRVYQYDQAFQQVRVWTEDYIEGTIVAGPVANLIGGMSFSEAFKAPWRITDYAQAGI